MKIDITKLPGYRADMTADEKLALIGDYEIAEPDYTGYIKKDSFDKTASELAEAKKQLRTKMSEDEQKEAERIANEAAMKEELATLRKEKTILDSKSRFLALGYDEKLAIETAAALADGDTDKVFANQGIHLENVKKAAAASALADDPKPPAGKGEQTITMEQFGEMGYSERLELFNNQPEIYNKLTGGTE